MKSFRNGSKGTLDLRIVLEVENNSSYTFGSCVEGV